MNQYEREELALEKALERGEISLAEFRKELSELRRDYQAAAQDAAWEAHERELERW